MTETATETTQAESTEASESIDYNKLFGPYAVVFSEIIPQAGEIAAEHDDLVASLAVKEGEVSEEVLENARIRNKGNNSKVKTLNDQITKLMSKLDELKAQAYDLVEDQIPQPLTDEEAAKVKERVKSVRDLFKSKIEAIQTVAASLNVSLDNVKLPSITANGRKTGSGTRSGHSGPRIRTDAVYINGELSEMAKPNDKTQKTSNLTSAALDISKVVKVRVGAVDLQKAYFAAAGITPAEDGSIDNSKLPVELEFPFVHTGADGTKTEFNLKVQRTV